MPYGNFLIKGMGLSGSKGNETGRCIPRGSDPSLAPSHCGILQGDWGFSTVFKQPVSVIIAERLAAANALSGKGTVLNTTIGVVATDAGLSASGHRLRGGLVGVSCALDGKIGETDILWPCKLE